MDPDLYLYVEKARARELRAAAARHRTAARHLAAADARAGADAQAAAQAGARAAAQARAHARAHARADAGRRGLWRARLGWALVETGLRLVQANARRHAAGH
ncbi:hypothetical protein [Nonomuraea sp. NPDC050783]|uniref:hypothetical protein n=1 Tax=Nonomuraea sp. NPDC050783 TaxID=3154634 RepID=UPI00346790BB